MYVLIWLTEPWVTRRLFRSNKCGAECRQSRKWQYESLEVEGQENRTKKNLHLVTNRPGPGRPKNWPYNRDDLTSLDLITGMTLFIWTLYPGCTVSNHTSAAFTQSCQSCKFVSDWSCTDRSTNSTLSIGVDSSRIKSNADITESLWYQMVKYLDDDI